MDQLSIPGDYRVECFPLAKSRLTLAPLIHILLLDICRLPQLYLGLPQSSAWLISHSIFKLYWYFSQLISLIWFMQSRVQRTVEERLNIRDRKIRKDLEVTWEEHQALDVLSFLIFQNQATKIEPSHHSHWLNPLIMLFKMHSFIFLFIHLPCNKCIPYILVVLLYARRALRVQCSSFPNRASLALLWADIGNK